MVSFKERLYLFTKTTIRVIAGDDIDEFAAVELSKTVGAISQRSVSVFGDYIIFLGEGGGLYFRWHIHPDKGISSHTLNDRQNIRSL
jgi:hypothetical protein